MSTERGDSTYKPKQKQKHPEERRPVRSTRIDKDYSEIVLVSNTDNEVEGEAGSGREDSIDFSGLTPTNSVKSEPSCKIPMAKSPDNKMTDVMQLMLKMQTENSEADLRRERDREAERDRREDQRRKEAEAREERILIALKEAQPVVPQTVTLMNHKLPKMEQGDQIEHFVSLFEAALKAAKIPEDQWCTKLHSNINMETKLKIHDTIVKSDATYQDIKYALLECSNTTFKTAAEKLMTADRGTLLKLPI